MFKSLKQRFMKSALEANRERPSRNNLPAIRRKELRELEEALGYTFTDLSLLDQALTHSSYAHEVSKLNPSAFAENYEAMEFLGDAILGLVISETLFLKYASLREGELSKMKSYLVSSRELSNLSTSLGLGRYLRLSRGEEKTGGRLKSALLADLFESVTAAIYLDGGAGPARYFIETQFQRILDGIERKELMFGDHKSSLQERLQGMGLPTPIYQVISESGPDHQKEFSVSVSSEGKVLAEGTGRSKKDAEREAAARALKVLELTSEKPS